MHFLLPLDELECPLWSTRYGDRVRETEITLCHKEVVMRKRVCMFNTEEKDSGYVQSQVAEPTDREAQLYFSASCVFSS